MSHGCVAKNETGMSLLSVLIGVSLLGVLAFALSSTIQSSMELSKDMRTRANLENLRSYLRARTDCISTFAAAGANCIGTQPALKASETTEIIGSSGVLDIGDFQIEAHCERKEALGNNAASKIINIKYRETRITDSRFIQLFKDIQICEIVL